MTMYVVSKEFTPPRNDGTPSLLDRITGHRKQEAQRFDLTRLLDQYQYPDVGITINGVDRTLAPAGVAVREDGTAFLYFRRKDASDDGVLYVGTPNRLRQAGIRRVRVDTLGTTIRFDDTQEFGRGVVYYPIQKRYAKPVAFLRFPVEDDAGRYGRTESLRRII